MKHKQYMTKTRKSNIKISRIVTGILTIFVLAFFGSWGYTEMYLATMPEPARAEVPRVAPEREMTLIEQICEATNGENCDVIYNLCKAESGCRKYAVNKNTNGTFDHSYLQINDVHIIGEKASRGKGTIKMECVYDLDCVSKWANEKIKKGQLHIWVAASKI